MSLKRKITIVSGGSRGIGKEIVLSLAAKGAIVYFTYLNNSEAALNVKELAVDMEGEVYPAAVDMRNSEQVKNFIRNIYNDQKRIDIVIHNAGIKKDKTLAFMSSDEWKEVMDTNLNSLFFLTNAVIPYLLKQKSGRVIIISSISGMNGIAGQTNYSASKAGMIGFVKSLAKEVAPFGIAVNTVAPGGVETDMTAQMNEKEKLSLISNVPVKRLCKPYEVARVVEFLADDDAAPDYLTGSVITLDGGQGH